MLSNSEKMLMVDALNGCHERVRFGSDAFNRMAGGNSVLKDANVVGLNFDDPTQVTASVWSSPLEFEIYDAIRLDGLDVKWGVDGPALLQKIRSLTVAQRLALIGAIAAIWERNDESFVRDVEALRIIPDGVATEHGCEREMAAEGYVR